ncbi:MAG TPA: hypothetical protein PKA21_08935 [Kiritimatiellia bacterium]|nr:hypothetical protein [Kiritimatiellia bacterium]HMP35022.1 hypothetical protein [Kiritimatiellia bacterium]
MNTKDIALRLFWTVVAAAGGALVAAQTLDVEALKAAGFVGLTAAINFITLLARAHLGEPPK